MSLTDKMRLDRYGPGLRGFYLKCWSSLFAYFYGGRTLGCETWGVDMVLEKWVVGRITQAKTQTDLVLWNRHFRRIYWL